MPVRISYPERRENPADSARAEHALDPIFTVPRLHCSTACSGPIEAIVFQMPRFEGNGKLVK